MYPKFPLFQSHLDFAHTLWTSLITSNDIVIDATCGNGHDTLYLAELPTIHIWAFDKQQNAIAATKERLPPNLQEKVTFINGCHSIFPNEIQTNSVKLIVYNLGYLPGGNKNITTEHNTTLKSLQNALTLLTTGGVISVTCYPGHKEGAVEEDSIVAWGRTLDPKIWSVTHHRWCNRKRSPSLLLIQKTLN